MAAPYQKCPICGVPVNVGIGFKLCETCKQDPTRFQVKQPTKSSIESKHLLFKEGPSKPKTKTWWVANKHSDICIGNIGWFAAWRKYGFFPEEDMVFEEDCLRDIADFIENKTKEHKNKSSIPSEKQVHPHIPIIRKEQDYKDIWKEQ